MTDEQASGERANKEGIGEPVSQYLTPLGRLVIIRDVDFDGSVSKRVAPSRPQPALISDEQLIEEQEPVASVAAAPVCH
jgi:hypothetical protein